MTVNNKTIHELAPGESSTITEVNGPDSLVLPLLKQGLTPGTQIEKSFSGIFGDPIAYTARGATIALRKEEAKCLQI
jgi:Fe2+ transport system protein FeoA